MAQGCPLLDVDSWGQPIQLVRQLLQGGDLDPMLLSRLSDCLDPLQPFPL
jgi:hypothetical protein